MLKIMKGSEIISPNRYFGLIYGQAGVGKSTIACSATLPLIIDTDNGIHRVEAKYRADTIQPECFQDILDLFNDPKIIGKYKTLVFDTFGSFLSLIEDYVAQLAPSNRQSNGDLTQKGYGARKKEFLRILKMAKETELSVLFIAHEKEERDGEERYIRPLATASSINDLFTVMEFVGYVSMIGNNRTINFNPTQRYYAKNSLGLPTNLNIPAIDKKNTFIIDFIEKRNAEKIANETKDIVDIDKLVLPIISDKKTDFNERITKIKTLKFTDTEKAKAMILITKQAVVENMVYSKADSKFIVKATEVVVENKK
jgi:hypothetical protein